MTAKQRENRARFKAVVQEAKKLRMKNPKLTQAQAVKQAWAISYSKKRSGKEIGALPVSFTGKILDIPFKVFHQYDIYNNVTSIVEDTNNGATIVRIDGTGSIQSKADQFSSYIKNRSGYSSDQYPTEFPKRIKKFVSQLQEEVKKFNAGKSNTIKKIPVEIKPKKSTMAKKSVKRVVRKKVATKKVAKQSGSSDRMRDMLYQAKKPGKRKTKWGTTYYESRANRSDKGRLLGTKGEYHKDTRSHNVNIRVVSGLPSYKDPDMAREIELYADSDSQLYYQRRKPILINLTKKYKKGTYDIDKAAKLWRYYIDAALMKYNKEFGSKGDNWYELMSVPDRNLLALEYARATKDEFDLGNFT